MTQEKHSPLPWRLEILGGAGNYICSNQNNNNIYLPVCGFNTSLPEMENKANADFIVRAVNNHDKLVNLLTKLTCLLEQSDGTTKNGVVKESREYLEALKAAKGE